MGFEPGAGLAATYAIARGMLGYWRFPEQRTSWGGPFNGQRNRMAIFQELHACYDFGGAFESGTYRGTTTSFLAAAIDGRVWTVELDPWSFGFCWARFCRDRRVRTMFGDSRRSIGRFVPLADRSCFFYLDAHWGHDLPLRHEVGAILGRFADAVLMIDDCRVEGDDGYGFDEYDAGQSISLDYIRRVSDAFEPRVFFPTLPAEAETGARRGCIILLGRGAKLPSGGFRTLREYRLSRRSYASGQTAAEPDLPPEPRCRVGGTP